jgi:hypothetical protein|nr:hypothetical protein [Neorhizobium tomejilense]
MIKAILSLSALNLALLPVIYLVHIDALDLRNCSVSAYLESDSVGSKFAECTSPRAHLVIDNQATPESAALDMQPATRTVATN